MLCPVCLSFGVQVEAVTVVNGTQYCGAHGIEALKVGANPRIGTRSQRGPGTALPGSFSLPVGAPVPQPVEPLPAPDPAPGASDPGA